MQDQKSNSYWGIPSSKLRPLGLLMVSVSALVASFTGQWYFFLFGIIGLALFALDAHHKGRLKQFIWLNVIYLLLFAILIYVQLKGIPWG